MEYKTILVPLDGSKLAEIVLPHVEKISKGCGVSKVILVTVTQPVRVKTPEGENIEQLPAKYQSAVLYYGNAMSDVGGEIVPATTKELPVMVGKMAKTGFNYLSRIAQKLHDNGIDATIAVLIGDVAAEIADFAKEEKADLIIMARPIRRSLRRWDVGNAIEKIFHITDIPILMIKPAAGFRETKPVRKGEAI